MSICLSLFLFSKGGLHEDHDVGSDSEGEDVRIPEEMDTSRPQEKQVDLFSEIHLNQMKKLEKQLEGVEGERNQLTKSLKEIQDQMEKGKSQVACLQAAVATIMSHIEALNNLKNEISKKVEKPEVPAPAPVIISMICNKLLRILLHLMKQRKIYWLFTYR